MKIEKFRDLTLVDLNDEQLLVISCDSLGGIGDKEGDLVKTSPEVSGYYTANVALMENLSFGARPISLVNNLSVEMDPAGLGIIRGIEKALAPLKLPRDSFITGSTEENIPVNTTGLGITVIGLVNKKDWKRPESKAGSLLVSVGIPKLGDEVVKDQERSIMNIERLLRLLSLDYIYEILPVGSKGIGYEAMEMARTNGLELEFLGDIDVDINTTAGPATCVLASIDEEDFESLEAAIDIKVSKIGYFRKGI